ncbi:DUF6037 family protein [Waltera sp.]|uniref:DUF6037 family protein n=1 Tax=Waltera sp. TaxID=2815806 RepID=UPI003AB2E9D2
MRKHTLIYRRGARDRSEFNADKTKLLRPSLYTYFSNDESISFCYYSDETMENDDETILKNFSSR